MYQKEIGYAAIDAGADLILGHHPHILKGIEVYKGKVIFYSLCNFVTPSGTHKSLGSTFYVVGKEKDADYPDYNLPFDSRKSMIAKIVVSDKKIARVSFLPLYINGHAQPEVPSRNDKRFDDVVSYMKDITESEGLNAKYEVDGEEMVIHD